MSKSLDVLLNNLHLEVRKMARRIYQANQDLLDTVGIFQEDLEGEAFARIMNELETYDPDRSEKVTLEVFCLYKARFAMKDMVRNAAKATSREENLIDNEDSPINPTSSEPEPDKVTHRALLITFLEECLDRLQPRELVVVKSRVLYDMKLKTLADSLGCSGERVRQIFLKALEKLRACLTAKGAGKSDIYF